MNLPRVPDFSAEGFVAFDREEDWEDIGGPESGPRIVGHPAYVEWLRGDEYIIVVDGEVAERGVNPPLPPGYGEGWEEAAP
jgi:hypothetical protein